MMQMLIKVWLTCYTWNILLPTFSGFMILLDMTYHRNLMKQWANHLCWNVRPKQGQNGLVKFLDICRFERPKFEHFRRTTHLPIMFKSLDYCFNRASHYLDFYNPYFLSNPYHSSTFPQALSIKFTCSGLKCFCHFGVGLSL